MLLDELKQIDEASICPNCDHAFIHHSMQSGCVHCECKLDHFKATRKALSNAIKQIGELEDILWKCRHGGKGGIPVDYQEEVDRLLANHQ